MLAYHAPPAQPGAFRRITVTLSPDARKKYAAAEIRTRSGYYAQ
jgi:hypothetical protein